MHRSRGLLIPRLGVVTTAFVGTFLGTFGWEGQPAAQQPKGAPTQQSAIDSGVRSAPATEPRRAGTLEKPAPPAAATAPGSPPSSSSDAAATPAPPPAASAGIPRGPSIHETGRVGHMGVSDSGVKIKHTQSAPKPQEQRVDQKVTSTTSAAPATQFTGVVNEDELNRALKPRLALLRDCRIEVARQKRKATGAVAAGGLTLRWIILPTGLVADTQVVAAGRVDGHVVDCVKRQMSQWTFVAPTGGPVLVERPLKFH